MIPQIGFSEMLVLVLLAVIVVGPKDLPRLMQTLGSFIRRMRLMAQEFMDAFNDMGAAQEMNELRREISELKKMGDLSTFGEATDRDLRDLDSDLRASTNMNNPKAGGSMGGSTEKPDT